jgi:hypothetical protein
VLGSCALEPAPRCFEGGRCGPPHGAVRPPIKWAPEASLLAERAAWSAVLQCAYRRAAERSFR